jgi:hypothetical protein
MKSPAWTFTKTEAQALSMARRVENFSLSCGLASRDARLLCLLGEEIISLVSGILPDFSATLTVENQAAAYEINLLLDVRIKPEEKTALLDLVGGKNSAYGQGVFGKIAAALVDRAIVANNQGYALSPAVSVVSQYPRLTGFGALQPEMVWMMSAYVSGPADKQHEISDDGLEKSIIVNLADECKIGVRANAVEITVIKQFN